MPAGPDSPLVADARALSTKDYADLCLRIVNKDAKTVKFKFNRAQEELDNRLEEQRKSGKPMRAIVLKARQVGISTYVQGKLIHRCTLRENQNAIVIAHDVPTGNKLYAMAEKMYGNLPEEVQPPRRGHRSGRFLHFAPPGLAWEKGDTWPNSTYLVDTAGEFQAGRGGTYRFVHASEFAFWERPVDKLTALLSAVPDDPETLVVIESTANGVNAFKDMWDQAEAGESGFIPFFWPWWKDEGYTLPFANDAEREAFEAEIGVGEWGQDEPKLLELFEAEGITGPAALERLNWRRRTIADKTAGKLDKFHQEFPSTPEESFIASGNAVFDTEIVKGILVTCDVTDPRVRSQDNPGPHLGTFKADEESMRVSMDRHGNEIKVPTKALWVPREDALTGDLWKLWLPPDEEPTSQYVIGVDVSGGETRTSFTDELASQPAFHAVQVIDHKTREQVAEYRSHVDPGLLARLIHLAALHFREAWVGVEITGGWGLPVVRTLYFDYHYPGVYNRRHLEASTEKQGKLLGWHTTIKTKPIIESNATELLREGEHGIKSRTLALEMLSYVRDDKGRTAPQPGRYSDLLIAWMIAQQIANEMPIRVEKKKLNRPAIYGPA